MADPTPVPSLLTVLAKQRGIELDNKHPNFDAVKVGDLENEVAAIQAAIEGVARRQIVSQPSGARHSLIGLAVLYGLSLVGIGWELRDLVKTSTAAFDTMATKSDLDKKADKADLPTLPAAEDGTTPSFAADYLAMRETMKDVAHKSDIPDLPSGLDYGVDYLSRLDLDGDKISGEKDVCPDLAGVGEGENNGCPAGSFLDDDKDNVSNLFDACKSTPEKTPVTLSAEETEEIRFWSADLNAEPYAGCTDADNDGVADVGPDGKQVDPCLASKGTVDARGCDLDQQAWYGTLPPVDTAKVSGKIEILLEGGVTKVTCDFVLNAEGTDYGELTNCAKHP